jgi:hypothetical protein
MLAHHAGCNMHGFNRSGGLQLGVWIRYPVGGMVIAQLSFLVGSLTVTIRYEDSR